MNLCIDPVFGETKMGLILVNYSSIIVILSQFPLAFILHYLNLQTMFLDFKKAQVCMWSHQPSESFCTELTPTCSQLWKPSVGWSEWLLYLSVNHHTGNWPRIQSGWTEEPCYREAYRLFKNNQSTFLYLEKAINYCNRSTLTLHSRGLKLDIWPRLILILITIYWAF